MHCPRQIYGQIEDHLLPMNPLLITLSGVVVQIWCREEHIKLDAAALCFLALFLGNTKLQHHHVIRGTSDVTDFRHGDIFTFISPATEKLEKQV